MYGSVTGWITYASARGTIIADNAVSAEALTRGSDFIKYHYVANFCPGYDDTLAEVEYAAYEAATKELATPGFFTATYSAASQKVLTKVEGIQWTHVGDGTKNPIQTTTVIDAMLEKYTCRKSGNSAAFMVVG